MIPAPRKLELYSFWTWIPAFVAASLTAQTGNTIAATSPEASLLAFGVIAFGGLGCVWGGLASDRIGRERLVMWAMAASGACALMIGLTFGRSLWLLVPVALGWGFFVIADSAQFSVLVTESVPPHAVGTALTMQTSLGFLLTTFAIQAVPPVVRAVGWALGVPTTRRRDHADVAAFAVLPSDPAPATRATTIIATNQHGNASTPLMASFAVFVCVHLWRRCWLDSSV